MKLHCSNTKWRAASALWVTIVVCTAALGVAAQAKQVLTGSIGGLRPGYLQLELSSSPALWVRTQSAAVVVAGKFSNAAALRVGDRIQVTGTALAGTFQASRITVLNGGQTTPRAFAGASPPIVLRRQANHAAAGGTANDLDCDAAGYDSPGTASCSTVLDFATEKYIDAAFRGTSFSKVQLDCGSSACKLTLRDAQVTGWTISGNGRNIELRFKCKYVMFGRSSGTT